MARISIEEFQLPFHVPVTSQTRQSFREILDQKLREADRETLILKIPRERHLLEKHRNMHFHFKPEVFLQLDGSTEFRFPHEKITLKEGEMTILPRGIPHHETVFPGTNPFRNLVVGFYSNTVSLHFAFEARPRDPDIEVIEFYETPDLARITSLVDTLVSSFHAGSHARGVIVKGLTLAFLGILRDLVDSTGEPLHQDKGKVFQTKWIVREQISNPKLNVKNISEKLRCSADYLSHLFAAETGETLIHYIHRQRITGATLALRTTPLSISEIAWASGFSNAGYFTRVFKRHTGLTPQEYRKREEEKLHRSERRPKTIFFDRPPGGPGQAVLQP